MQFQIKDIDKARYQRHLNRVMIACIVALVVLSLGVSQSLILFMPDPSGSHFHWNLTGVIFACVVVGMVLKRVKDTPYMKEVLYVWQLKQMLNQITRRLRHIENNTESANRDAFKVLDFYYAGCRQLWQLDDNTITMDELSVKQTAFSVRARECGVSLGSEQGKALSITKDEVIQAAKR